MGIQCCLIFQIILAGLERFYNNEPLINISLNAFKNDGYGNKRNHFNLLGYVNEWHGILQSER